MPSVKKKQIQHLRLRRLEIKAAIISEICSLEELQAWNSGGLDDYHKFRLRFLRHELKARARS